MVENDLVQEMVGAKRRALVLGVWSVLQSARCNLLGSSSPTTKSLETLLINMRPRRTSSATRERNISAVDVSHSMSSLQNSPTSAETQPP